MSPGLAVDRLLSLFGRRDRKTAQTLWVRVRVLPRLGKGLEVQAGSTTKSIRA